MKEWILLDQATDIAATDTLPLPISRILNNRGYDNPTAIDQFLNPQLKDLHSPYVFPDMEKATRRIIEAQKRREKILIYGDYDADGVTSTAMLVLALKSLGIGTTYYIPHRIREGYGLSRAGVDFCLEHDFSVMITVDCGTGAVEEIAAAKNQTSMSLSATTMNPAKNYLFPLPFSIRSSMAVLIRSRNWLARELLSNCFRRCLRPSELRSGLMTTSTSAHWEPSPMYHRSWLKTAFW